MTDYRRYAIYFTPEPNSDLARFGTHWLGWDCDAGAPAAHLSIDTLGEEISELTERPRRYGFHATLKAPFFLHPEKSPLELHHAVQEFASGHQPVHLPGLALSDRGGFLALRSFGDESRLVGLAGHLVRGLDAYRAPMSETELAKWRNRKLSDRQRRGGRGLGLPVRVRRF